MGNAAALGAETDPLVVAHAADAPAISGAEPLLKADPDDRPASVDVDLEVVDGVRFRTHAGSMDVVATPGHVSLHAPEHGRLLAADAATATESVVRLADPNVDRVVAYHGGTVAATGADLRALVDD